MSKKSRIAQKITYNSPRKKNSRQGYLPDELPTDAKRSRGNPHMVNKTKMRIKGNFPQRIWPLVDEQHKGPKI
jgi:hypothetical protein